MLRRRLFALALLAAISWLVRESSATDVCDGKGYPVEGRLSREASAMQRGFSVGGVETSRVTCLSSCLKCADGFTIQPEDVVAVVGQMVQMDCQHEATFVNWEKDGTTILDSDDTIVHSNGTLQFNSVDLEDVGTYDCVARVGFGTSVECSAKLRLAGELVWAGLGHMSFHMHTMHTTCAVKSAV